MEHLATLHRVRDELNALLIERDELVDGVLLALLARQHVLLIGPPGTAKSMLARELCRRLGGAYVEWLLTKFTTPEEIFGPVSLPALEQGRFERVTTNKLPEAEIAFLDEIFKANSAILNSLLTLLNERHFYHGAARVAVPLQSLIGASNELPEEEELAALYDRFALRFTVGYIEQDQHFKALLSMTDDTNASEATVLGGDALESLRQQCTLVSVPRGIIAEIVELRNTLATAGVIASDRRYRHALSVLRASALLNGRTSVNHHDLLWMEHILWSDPQERPRVLEALASLNTGFDEEARKLLRQAVEIDAYAKADWPSKPEADRALLEAHTKLGEIHRRFDTMQTAARERGRDAAALENGKQKIADIQRALLASETTWLS